MALTKAEKVIAAKHAKYVSFPGKDEPQLEFAVKYKGRIRY